MKKKIFTFVFLLLLVPMIVFAEDEDEPQVDLSNLPELTCIYYKMGESSSTYPVMFVQFKDESGQFQRSILYPNTLALRNSLWTPGSKADKNWAVIKEAYLNTTFTTKKVNGNWLLSCPKYARFSEGGMFPMGSDKYTSGTDAIKNDPPELELIDENFVRMIACKNDTSITTDQACIEKIKTSTAGDYTLKELQESISEYREGDGYGTVTDEAVLHDSNAITCEYQYQDQLKIEIKFNQKQVAISKEEKLTNNNLTSSLLFTGEEIYKSYQDWQNTCPKLETHLQGTDVGWILPAAPGPGIGATTDQNLNNYISNEASCNGLLGAEMTKIVNNIFTTIQYLGPVLVIVLSIVDFAKAALSGEATDMKKAYEKLIKRIICGVLLFFVPLICKLLFSVTGVTVPETCIGK